MITDKDREDLIYDLRAYIDGWCLEEGKERDKLIEFENAVRAEAAEEARKEAADVAVEWVNKNLCDEHMPIMYKRLEEDELRAAILKEATG